MAGDPVAEKSTFLRMYMLNHPDTLVAYAKHYAKVEAPIVSAELTDINTKSMTILCTLKSGGKQPATITFTPLLAGYEAVKPRLLEMKAIAQENLGMIKTPHITSFEFRSAGYRDVTMFILPVFAFLHYFPQTKLAQPMIGLICPSMMKAAYQTTVIIHAFEALYTLSLCRKHKTGFLVGTLYGISTFICGFPMIRRLRGCIQKARIDSVMKVQ